MAARHSAASYEALKFELLVHHEIYDGLDDLGREPAYRCGHKDIVVYQFVPVIHMLSAIMLSE